MRVHTPLGGIEHFPSIRVVAPVSLEKSAMSKPHNPDLQKEREQASFPVEELTYLLQGGKSVTEKRRKLSAIVSSNAKLNKVKEIK